MLRSVSFPVSFVKKNLLPIHTEALEIRRNVLGDGHPDMANSYNTCGAYVSMGNYDKAIEYFEKAFRILKPLLGEYHPHTKIVLEKTRLYLSSQRRTCRI